MLNSKENKESYYLEKRPIHTISTIIRLHVSKLNSSVLKNRITDWIKKDKIHIYATYLKKKKVKEKREWFKSLDQINQACTKATIACLSLTDSTAFVPGSGIPGHAQHRGGMHKRPTCMKSPPGSSSFCSQGPGQVQEQQEGCRERGTAAHSEADPWLGEEGRGRLEVRIKTQEHPLTGPKQTALLQAGASASLPLSESV